MRKTWQFRLLWFGMLLGIQSVSPLFAAGQSSSNGIYGGYVGSGTWFSSMRRAAENQAMLRALGQRATGPGEIPPGYIEFAGQITFPAGNPFPDHRLPDLRIKCHDPGADGVERAPFLSREGSFYTVFKKGQTYDFSWMYYFGSKEKFATLTISENAPRQVKDVIEYRYQQPARVISVTPGSLATREAETNEQGPSEGSPEKNGEPLTERDLVDLLKGDVPQRRVESLVRQYGVAFQCSKVIEGRLRDAGATDSLLSVVCQSARHAGTAPPTSESPQNPETPAPGSTASAAPASVGSARSDSVPKPPPEADRFDLSGLPKEATNFEEQQIFEAVHTATTPGLKAFAHAKLARYYEKKGDSRRAAAEDAKAQYWNHVNN